MAGLDFKSLLGTAAEAPDFSPLAPNKYTANVTGCTVKDTMTGKKMWNIEFTVAEGPSQGRKAWTNQVLSPENATALSIFFRQMAAMGLDNDYFATEPSPEEIAAKLIATGAAVIIEVVTRKDDATRNDIKNIFPVAGGSPVGGPQGAISGAATAPPNAPF